MIAAENNGLFSAAVSKPPEITLFSAADLWPLFDALDGVPLAVVRGANSDLLTAETVAKMQARRPDLIVAEVSDCGHVPFLDEPEALDALDALVARVGR